MSITTCMDNYGVPLCMAGTVVACLIFIGLLIVVMIPCFALLMRYVDWCYSRICLREKAKKIEKLTPLEVFPKVGRKQ